MKYNKVATEYREVEAVFYDGSERTAKQVQKLNSGVTFNVDDANKTDFNVSELRAPSGSVGASLMTIYPNTWVVAVPGGLELVKDEDFKRDYVKA
jgi:ABC-type Fe3+ transport system substrate-binding protein